jgi:shikimate dehydrogenase
MTASKKILLLGYPVAHSRSPAMHNAALQAVGLDNWSYTSQAVPPEELPQAVAQLRQSGYAGANVTIPHKERIIPLLDRLTPAAEAIGAVNTIFKEGKALVGDNTDAPGFLVDLRYQVTNLKAKDNHSSMDIPASSKNAPDISGFFPKELFIESNRALVLGAGGSARAIVYALTQAGWQVLLAARRHEQALSIASQYPSGTVQAIPFHTESLQSFTQSAGYPTPIALLLNTTPLGMHPNVEDCPWPAELPLPAGAFVYDLIYEPSQTVLLTRAKFAGLPYANGLGMLVEQAILSFERWTGIPAPRSVMFQAVQV